MLREPAGEHVQAPADVTGVAAVVEHRPHPLPGPGGQFVDAVPAVAVVECPELGQGLLNLLDVDGTDLPSSQLRPRAADRPGDQCGRPRQYHPSLHECLLGGDANPRSQRQ
ncbi:MAG: hypothetical protein AUG44_01085 [Actinobacteria bacterium 13_1_20CM_3_71_11]|nr:MAG: hypothetical protein AUG44_01085 [Actinobacteria bacterium 13_1_20CM_3_71_11]